MDELLEWLISGDGDRAQVVLLPRDPETAFVYWQMPAGSEEAELQVVVRDGAQANREVKRFSVDQARSGRFFQFAGPDMEHRCELSWSGGQVVSPWIRSPRRAPGTEPATFVRVEWAERGLLTAPVDHEVQGRGFFRARSGGAPSSGAFIGRNK